MPSNTASRKPDTALVSLLSVALSSVSVKQVYYIMDFIKSFYIFKNCPLYWVHIRLEVVEGIGHPEKVIYAVKSTEDIKPSLGGSLL